MTFEATPSFPGEGTPAGPAIEPGARIGRFTVVRLLGTGGMGAVYEAEDPELGRKVALKTLRGDLGEGHELRLVREAQALAQLTHPNVVAIHEVGAAGGRVFIAMEHIDGLTLGAHLAGGRPSWRDVTALFVQAGRGLAAAHARGIVHRDFKPSNVLVDGEGRARVTDFGLARMLAGGEEAAAGGGERPAGDEATTVDAGEPSVEQPPARGDVLAFPLTRAGTFLGTPRYMSPEQKARQPAGERSDQYSFCLAFWEALMGDLPPRRRRGAPGWLVRALEKGLAEAPAGRHPSMVALLRVLEQTPGRRRRVMAGVAGLAAASLVAGAIAVATRRARDDETARCRRAGEGLAGVWDDATRAAARQRFLASGHGKAEATFTKIAGSLDAWAAGWSAMRSDVCLATQVRREQSAELHDLRMACLDERRAELAAVTRVLGGPATPSIVDNAERLVAGVPPTSLCADAEALRAAYPAPADPELRRQLVAARARVLDADAVGKSGRPRDAVALGAAALATARALGHPPLAGEAGHILGSYQREAGQYADAEATLRAAVQQAAIARDDRRVAQIWMILAIIVGNDLGRVDDGLELVEVARAAVSRAGDKVAQRAFLVRTKGILLRRKGRNGEAITALTEAVSLSAEMGDVGGTAHAASSLGLALRTSGRLVEAEAQLLRSSVLYGRAYGPAHISVASPLESLSEVYLDEGRFAEARGLLQRVLILKETALGPDHPTLAATHYLLGLVLARLGEGDESTRHCDRALAMSEARGPDSKEVAITTLRCGEAALALGDLARAERLVERCAGVSDKVYGAGSPYAAGARVLLGQTLLRRPDARRLATARADFEGALAVLDKTAGAEPDVASALVGLARCDLLAHAAGAAVPRLERAVAIRRQHAGANALAEAEQLLSDARRAAAP